MSFMESNRKINRQLVGPTRGASDQPLGHTEKQNQVKAYTRNQSPSGRSKWLYILLLIIVAGGILYTLLANTGGGEASTLLRENAIAYIQRTLQASSASPIFAPLALGVAFLLGGLHTLAPGHNKTLVGAYLVGSRARLRHAVLIGAATALSHTASAIVLGLLTLTTAGQIFSTQYLRWIGLPTGLLTLALGIWLLRVQLRGGGEPEHAHAHGHSHAHGSDHKHEDQRYLASTRITLGGLVALGLAHGIVPTFDALAILLVALNVERVSLGVGLILAYSLGIGGAMTAIGVLFLRAQRLLIDNARFERISRWAPTAAAALVLLLGLWLILRTLVVLIYTVQGHR